MPNLVVLRHRASFCRLPCYGFEKLRELYCEECSSDQEKWDLPLLSTTQLHALQELQIRRHSLADYSFMEIMGCVQNMRDLCKVSVTPYYGNVLEEQGVLMLAPFSGLSRSTILFSQNGSHTLSQAERRFAEEELHKLLDIHLSYGSSPST